MRSSAVVNIPSSPVTVGQREQLKRWNEEQLALFKLSHDARTELKIREGGIFSLFAEQETVYHKEEIAIGIGGKSKVVIITKNGKPDSFCWRTGPEQLRHAIRYGIIKPDSLSGKVKSVLATYRKIVIDRIINPNDEFISDKCQEKDAILTLVQDRIDYFEPLELLINSGASKEEVVNALQKCCSQLENKKNGLGPDICLLDKYHKDATEEIKAFFQSDIDNLNLTIDKLEKSTNNNLLQDYTSPTGRHSLMTVVKENMFCAIEQAKYLNKIMIDSDRSFSSLRGDLHNCLCDANDVIADHKAYHRSVVDPTHQGSFQEVDGTWSVDFEALGGNQQAIDHTLMAISLIEDDDAIKHDKHYNFCLVDRQEPDNLKKSNKTAFTKWAYAKSENQTGLQWVWNFTKRIGIFVCNVVTGLGKAIPCILYGLWVGLTGIESPRISSWLANKAEKRSLGTSKFAFISNKMKVATEAGTFKLGKTIGYVIRQIGWEALRGTWFLVKTVLYDVFTNIRHDKIIAQGLRDRPDIFRQFNQEIAEIRRRTHETKESLDTQHETQYGKKLFNGNPVKAEEIKSQFALPPYHLTTCDGNDIFSAIAQAARAGLLTIPRAMPAKHPVIGLIFMLSSLVGLKATTSSSVSDPHSWWESYVKFMQEQQVSMSSGPAAFVSVSFAQSQLISGLAELVHGRKSWLAELLRSAETDPDQIVVLLGGLYLIGQGLIHMPDMNLGPILGAPAWIGKKIAEEMGTGDLKWLTFFTATAKISLIIYELFEVPHGVHDAAKEVLISQLNEAVEEWYRSSRKLDEAHELKQEQQQDITVCVQHILREGPEHIRKCIDACKISESSDGEEKRAPTTERSTVQLETLTKHPFDGSVGFDSERTYSEKKDHFDFLSEILSNAGELHLLSDLTKREMLALAQEMFGKDQEDICSAVETLLYPNPKGSIIANTLHLLGKLLMNFERVLAIPYTGYYKALPKFLNTVKDLMVSIWSLVCDLCHIVGTLTCIALRWPVDLVFNKFLKYEGFARKALTWIDVTYEQARQLFSTPTDVARKSATKVSTHVIQQALGKMQPPLKARVEAPVVTLQQEEKAAAVAVVAVAAVSNDCQLVPAAARKHKTLRL